MRHGLKAWLLLALLVPGLASAAPSYKGWAAGAFLQGPDAGECASDDASPIPGQSITISGCPAFAGNVTTLTAPSGDTITCSSSCSTTGGVFGIPAALVGFIAAGSMQDTEWGVDGTWTIGDGSTTENITLRVDPAGTTGPTYFFGTVVGPEAGDSVFPPAAAATDGDEYYVEVISGSSVSVNANGSTSAASDYEVTSTIWDESANDSAGQWTASENTVFDSTAPSLDSAAIDATGLLFTPTFDEAVIQGAGYADSDLTLTCSGGSTTLAYSAGDGTTTPDYTISRTVESGETCTIAFDGSANSLEDAVGNDVASFSGESVTNNSSGDVTPPTVSTVTIAANGTDVTIALDENGNVGSGGSGGFSLVMSGGTTPLTYASGDGTSSLVFNPGRTIGAGETGTLTYVQPDDGIEDDSTNDLASFSGQAVTNNSAADVTAPTIDAAAVLAAGATIAVGWAEAVSEGASYDNGDWTVTASGGAVTVSSVAGDGTASWTLTLSRPLLSGETVTLGWVGTANGMEDAAGNDVAAFSDEPVTNNSTETLPAFASASVNGAGDELAVVFSESMTQAGSYSDGDWTVTASGGALTLTYDSGNTTDTHVFATSRTVDQDEVITLAWAGTASGLQDSASHDLAAFSDEPVTNGSTQDLVAPTVTSARISAAAMTVYFSEEPFQGAGYDNADWTVTCSGGAVSPALLAIGSISILFELSREVTSDETCTLAHDGTANSIEDSAGNDLATFSGQAVTISANAGIISDAIRDALRDALRDAVR